MKEIIKPSITPIVTENRLNGQVKTSDFFEKLEELYYETDTNAEEFYLMCLIEHTKHSETIKKNKDKICDFFKNNYAYHRGYEYNMKMCLRGIIT